MEGGSGSIGDYEIGESWIPQHPLNNLWYISVFHVITLILSGRLDRTLHQGSGLPSQAVTVYLSLSNELVNRHSSLIIYCRQVTDEPALAVDLKYFILLEFI